MRLAVLGNRDSWYVRDLVRAASHAHEVVPVSFREIASSVNTNSLRVTAGEYDLNQFDAVLVRTMPAGSLEQIVFRMDALAQLEHNGTVVLNPPRAIEAAVDKFLATARLQAAGLPVPKTIACQTPQAAIEAFHQLGTDVVVKPLFGSEGRGITRINDEAIATRVFHTLASLGAVIYVQQFIEHEGFDLRLMVIGEQVFGMRRGNLLDWRTNVSRGATAEPVQVAAHLATMAQRAAAAVGAPLAGVDILSDRQGNIYVIEVNAVPGWRALSQTLDIDVASLVLEYTHNCIAQFRIRK